MRAVLALFGGGTGAADGYARMADKPAATLCCTWAAAWATAWPTCTTRAGKGAVVTSWATMPPPTRSK